MAKSNLEIIVGLTDKASSKAKGILSAFQGIATVAGGIISAQILQKLGASVVNFANDSISSASNLNEAMNASSVVFGDAAGVIQDFGKTASSVAGLSAADFNQMAAQTGAMLTNFGIDAQTAAQDTIDLTQRAADMASIFNTDVADAMTAVQAGLRGESEPLRRFGVSLSQVTVEAKALEMGFTKVNGAFDQNSIAQARMALIMEQTAKISGDFVNTSDELANATRVQEATFENFRAKLGQDFLPVILGIKTAFMTIAEAVMPAVLSAIGPITAWLQTVVPLLGNLLTALLDGGPASDDFSKALAALVGEDTATKIVDLVTAVQDFTKATKETLDPVFKAIGEFISWKDIAIILAGVMAGALLYAIIGIVTALGPVLLAVSAVIAIVSLMRTAWESDFLGIQESTQYNINIIKNIISGALAIIQGWWSEHGDRVTSIVQGFWNAIQSVWETVTGILSEVFAAFKSAFEGDWYSFGEHIRKAWDELWEAVKNVFTGVKTWFSTKIPELIRNIKDYFTSTDWGSIGREIVNGIARGITSAVQWLKDAAMNAAKAALNAAKGFLGIRSPSTVFAEVGKNMMLGMAGGITGNANYPVGAIVGAASEAVDRSNQVTNNFYLNAQYPNQSPASLTEDVRMLQLMYAK